MVCAFAGPVCVFAGEDLGGLVRSRGNGRGWRGAYACLVCVWGLSGGEGLRGAAEVGVRCGEGEGCCCEEGEEDWGVHRVDEI